MRYKHVQGGNVPGGHRVLWDGGSEPFITPTREMDSIPLRHSDVVVDIGAYVGTYAVRCARFPVKRVVAYEPTPPTFDVLRINKADLPNLEIVQAAVVPDDRESVSLFVSSGIGVTNSIVKHRRKAGAVVVPAVRYEDAVAGASVVKIDVEGAEYLYPVVQPSLRAIIIDFHPLSKRDWVGAAEEMIRGFEGAGFDAVVEPDFSCGWTQAGSWVRPMETSGCYEPMMRGAVCCGCGAEVEGDGGRTLCPYCWEQWSPKHRIGYTLGALKGA